MPQPDVRKGDIVKVVQEITNNGSLRSRHRYVGVHFVVESDPFIGDLSHLGMGTHEWIVRVRPQEEDDNYRWGSVSLICVGLEIVQRAPRHDELTWTYRHGYNSGMIYYTTNTSGGSYTWR